MYLGYCIWATGKDLVQINNGHFIQLLLNPQTTLLIFLEGAQLAKNSWTLFLGTPPSS